jgi:hypothetical protein
MTTTAAVTSSSNPSGKPTLLSCEPALTGSLSITPSGTPFAQDKHPRGKEVLQELRTLHQIFEVRVGKLSLRPDGFAGNQATEQLGDNLRFGHYLVDLDE